MSSHSLRRGAAVFSALLIGAGLLVTPAAQAADPAYQVLVFSKTAGFRHDSIPAGIQTVRDLGAANNFTVTATEDASLFTPAELAKYKAVVFMSTTGDVLNDTQQTAFQSYIDGGGGYVGVHSAADTEYSWPYYGQLVGAWFLSHPAIQQANFRTEDRANPATSHLAPVWTRTDELYNYRTNPRPNVHVLQDLDESSYSGGAMGADHPITWCHPQANGRAFYTGLGHTIESYADTAFRTELLGGIRYAAGFAMADCRPENGYTSIYNGSTSGWTQNGTNGFGNANATLTSSGGPGLLWYSAKEYHAYSLKLDWKLNGDGDSGVFLGFPNTGAGSAGTTGYEVNIDASDTSDRTTGAVFGSKGADIAARDKALNPAGQWNTFELQVAGERLQVFLNGVKINDFTNTDPARSLQQGYVGIQNIAANTVSYRNIRIKESGSTVAKTVEGESYTSSSGVQIAAHSTASGGNTLGYIDNGDWAGYSSVSTAGVTSFSARIASAGAGGTIDIRSGSATGPVLGSVAVPSTGSWDVFQTVSTSVSGGSGPLFLGFRGGSGSLFDVDTLTVG
jgi:type 1 glutamine amidotransferase